MDSFNIQPSGVTSNTLQSLFLIEVFQQGVRIATHTVEASDALTAIDQVERYYGAPLELEDVLVDDTDTGRHHIMLVNNWRGYMFQARLIHPAVKSEMGMPPLVTAASGAVGAHQTP